MRRAVVSLLLVVLTVTVYAQVRSFGFINLDDAGYVRDNAQVLAGLSPAGVVWAFTTTSQANWHPLTWLSLQLDAQHGGSSPGVYHTTNLVLHVAGVLLLFLLFARMTGACGGAPSSRRSSRCIRSTSSRSCGSRRGRMS